MRVRVLRVKMPHRAEVFVYDAPVAGLVFYIVDKDEITAEGAWFLEESMNAYVRYWARINPPPMGTLIKFAG